MGMPPVAGGMAALRVDDASVDLALRQAASETPGHMLSYDPQEDVEQDDPQRMKRDHRHHDLPSPPPRMLPHHEGEYKG